MMRSRRLPGRSLYLTAAGAAQPYARYFQPAMAPLPEATRAALATGPVAEELLPPLYQAPASLAGADVALENGFCLAADGSMRVAARTDMHGVTPDMWDWWFGWHSDSPDRYKLWHPHAHMHAAWVKAPPPGARGRARYVGYTSVVDEYLGSTLIRGAISFLDPARLGFSSAAYDPARATIIAARTGSADAPLDVGYLVHEIRAVPGGSVMRSRFWMGGPYLRGRSTAGHALAALARPLLRLSEADARALLVHDAQEMGHLASFLPALHAEFGET